MQPTKRELLDRIRDLEETVAYILLTPKQQAKVPPPIFKRGYKDGLTRRRD